MNRSSTVLHPVTYPTPPPLRVTEGARWSLAEQRRALDQRHHGVAGSLDERASCAVMVESGLGGTEDGRC